MAGIVQLLEQTLFIFSVSTDIHSPPLGIHIESHDHVSRCTVANNVIHNTGSGNAALDDKRPGEPAIHVGGANASHHVAITGNVIHNARGGGIIVRNLRDSHVNDNAVSTAAEPIIRINCRGVRERGNLTTRPAATRRDLRKPK